MKNTIKLENGIIYNLTPNEIKVIKIAISNLSKNDIKEELNIALNNLKELFLEHLD